MKILFIALIKKVEMTIPNVFTHRFQYKTNKFFDIICGKFKSVLNFFETFTNSKIIIRTQIFPKIDKKRF
jgi:hypothetical protein